VSYDLQVFAKRQPKASEFDAFLSTHTTIAPDGRFKRNGYVLLTATDGVHAEIDMAASSRSRSASRVATAAEDFIRRWVEEAEAWPPMLFWTAARPCLGGSAFMSPRLDRDPPPPGVPISRVSIRLDGRALARDPDLTERMVELFTAEAIELGCVYAAGSVHRDLLMKQGRESADYRTEAGPMPRANRWVGLPATPTWLTWFGRPYADLVRSSVSQHITAKTDGALFLRLGPDPMDSDQLADAFPPLPVPLIAHRINKPPAWEVGIRYTLASGPPSQLAEQIPVLA
jgi:hypothetical protein